MDVVELMNKELLRRKYSLKTIKSYIYCLRKFLKYCHKEEKRINKKDVKDYLDNLADKNKSGSTINVNLQALKFLVKEILHKNFTVKIKYSKLPKSLPVVLTQEEVLRLINSIKNDKHRLMVKLMYSAGLRVSELLNLRIKDLQLDNNFGWVRKGKGNKDRLFIIAESLKKELKDYIRQNMLNEDSLLFESYNGRMSVRTPQVIIKKAIKKAGINKRVSCHTLRHSFATHLIENGYDVASVQSLLGHNSMETTMVYVHIASPRMINIRSPLDNLQLGNGYKKFDYENKNLREISLIGQEYRNFRI